MSTSEHTHSCSCCHDEHEHHHDECCGHEHGHHHADACGCGHHHEHEHCHGDSCGCGHEHVHHGEGGLKKAVIRLALAAALFAVSYLIPEGLYRRLFLFLPYLVAGYDVLWSALRGILRGHVFDENFLMAAATVGRRSRLAPDCCISSSSL